MARSPVLGGASLNPFGGAGVDFGAFDVASNDRESALVLTRVEIAWAAGKASNTEYLAALRAYANTITPNTTTRLDAEARIETVKYRVEREVIAANVDNGISDISVLLEYDRGKLAGLKTDSEEYLQRQNVYKSTQQRAFSEAEKEVVDSYNNGQMTTAQLNLWYTQKQADPLYDGNHDIDTHIGDRHKELATKVIAERDQQVLQDYQDGKTSPSTFVTYAVAARGRYVPDSQDYKQWDQRLNDAKDSAAETGLLYRYDLSQQYAQLQKFIQSAKPPTGSKGTPSRPSTATSTRTILGSDGKWHTVTTKTGGMTKGSAATGPTPGEQAAWKNMQIEIADAKVQMKQIEAKMAGIGGFVATPTVITYYQKELGKVANGSSEWYAIQGKLDSLNEKQHQESVMAKQHIKITYPKTAAPKATASSAKSSGAAVSTASAPKAKSDISSLDQFLNAIAHVESGGRYTAENTNTHAYGKYQIMPANWPGWAKKYLGNANAPQTPENQEKLVRAKMTDLYNWLGDWNLVAHQWLTGGGSKNPNEWSKSSTHYVNNVMAGMGRGPVSSSTVARTSPPAGTAGSATIASKGTATKAAAAATGPSATASRYGADLTTGAKPVLVVTGHAASTYQSPEGATVRAGTMPSNDSSAFTKFYTQYSNAFKTGQTEFTINGVSYYVGQDLEERAALMLEVDTMRVGMFDEKARAYAGKPAGITASNESDNARADAAGNMLRIIDGNYVNPDKSESARGPRSAFDIEHTSQTTGTSRDITKGGEAGNAKNVLQVANPIALGNEMLSQAETGIKLHNQRSADALARGDLTTAYAESQMSAFLFGKAQVDLEAATAASHNAVQSVEKGFGVGRAEALKSEGAGTLTKDLGALDSGLATLQAAMATGAPTTDELQRILAKDSAGNPVKAGGGQVFLDEKKFRNILSNGKTTVEPITRDTRDARGEAVSSADDTMQRVRFFNGTNVVDAYAKFKVVRVGTLKTATGDVALMGKSISYVGPDGKSEMWNEDPLNPGTWSNKAIVYSAGAGVTTQSKGTGPNATQVLIFKGKDNADYSLMPDPKTGTYIAFQAPPTGFGSPKSEPVELGGVVKGSVAWDQLTGTGTKRDGGLVTDPDKWAYDMNAPFIGGGKSQYIKWATPVYFAADRAAGSRPSGAVDRPGFDVAHHPGAESSFTNGKLTDLDRGAGNGPRPPGRDLTPGEPDWYARQISNNTKPTMVGTDLSPGKKADDTYRQPVPKALPTIAPLTGKKKAGANTVIRKPKATGPTATDIQNATRDRQTDTTTPVVRKKPVIKKLPTKTSNRRGTSTAI